MKIAIFSDNFYPEISGISDSVILLSKQLAELGHEIHFFAPRYSAEEYRVANIPFVELDLGKNIIIHRLWSLPLAGSPSKQARLVMPTGIQAWKYRQEKFDIIYTQDPFGLGIEALLMSRFLRIPLVGTNHTPITEFTRYLPLHNEFFNWVGLKYFAWYYNRCQFVTAPYQGLLDEMKASGFKKPCRTLSNPIDTQGFLPVGEDAKKELKNKYGLSENTVLYTGRLAAEKQIDVIIRAIAEVKKAIPHVNLAITGHGSAEEELRKLAEKIGLKENVKFFGRVDDTTHAQLYRASDIFAIMSTAEAQSLSLMKAMSVGLPVIGADARALPDYIGKASSDRGFVVPVGNVVALAEKIIFLFKNPEQRTKMGQNAAAFVKDFAAGKIAQQWQGIFMEARANRKKTERQADLKLSFVIPAYNEEKYIGKCLESIFHELKRSKLTAEIIVVNNASTDKTKKVAESFPGVRVVDEFEKGLVRARRAGYLASTGDIIANVDSDAVLPAGWIEKVFAEFSKDNDLVALSGPYIYPEMSKAVNFLVNLYYRFGYLGHLINHYLLGSGAVLQGGNFIVRRTAMEKIGGFNLEFDFYGEDTDVARRIQKVGKVLFTFDLPMHTSSRRFEGEGLVMTAIRYAINHFWTMIFKKPFTKKYNDFREGENL